MAKKQTKYARVCGMEFSGETVAAAKETGEREVTRLAREANLGPSMYQIGEITAVIWPVLEGWGYTLIGGPTNGKAPNGIMHASTVMGGTRNMAALSAIAHAAQWQWTHDVADDAAYFTRAFSCVAVKSDDMAAAVRVDIAEGIRHAAWQRRWKALFDQCGDKNVAHDIASRTGSIDDALAMLAKQAA